MKLCDGKYDFHVLCGKLYCDRNGEHWRDFVGDKAVRALFDHAEDAARFHSDEMKNRLEAEALIASLQDANCPADAVGAINYLVDHAAAGWFRVAELLKECIELKVACKEAKPLIDHLAKMTSFFSAKDSQGRPGPMAPDVSDTYSKVARKIDEALGDQ